jgi:hypothetical protein
MWDSVLDVVILDVTPLVRADGILVERHDLRVVSLADSRRMKSSRSLFPRGGFEISETRTAGVLR